MKIQSAEELAYKIQEKDCNDYHYVEGKEAAELILADRAAIVQACVDAMTRAYNGKGSLTNFYAMRDAVRDVLKP